LVGHQPKRNSMDSISVYFDDKDNTKNKQSISMAVDVENDGGNSILWDSSPDFWKTTITAQHSSKEQKFQTYCTIVYLPEHYAHCFNYLVCKIISTAMTVFY